MTTLGAAIYFGFFAVAALWLFLTADRPVERGQSGECAADGGEPVQVGLGQRLPRQLGLDRM